MQEMRIQARDDSPIHIGDEVIQRTDHFTYLGSVMSESGGTEEDIVARIRKAQQAFATLRSVWKSRAISLNTKLRIFKRPCHLQRSTRSRTHKYICFIFLLLILQSILTNKM